MESEESSTRPSIGFPLGLALLLLLLFFMTGFFTCCLHWDKLRSLLRPSTYEQEDIQHLPHKSTPPPQESKQKQGQSLPVLMPGDKVPKFIAMACPCEPSAVDKIIVKVEKPSIFPVPLYL